MENWRGCLLDVNKAIVDAVKIIDTGGAKIAVIIDTDGKLQGTVTDYDVRQAILSGKNLSDRADSIMNRHPKYMTAGCDLAAVMEKMRADHVRQMPLVNDDNIVMGMWLIDEFNKNYHKRNNPVLLMAGGLGTRLRPLTDACPKPLLKIGNKPILEIILDNFIDEGFSDFYISVNYKADMVKEYFRSGERFGVSIQYLQEKKRLGTAGALSLLPPGIKDPLIVMNGDLLTKVDFHQLLDFHYHRQSTATMCVREYKYQVPYGVIRFEDWKMQGLKEKPVYTEFVNAGIYVLNPDIFYNLQSDTYTDMPDVFSKNIKAKKRTLVFPIREYWLDVGRMEDFERAQEEFR